MYHAGSSWLYCTSFGLDRFKGLLSFHRLKGSCRNHSAFVFLRFVYLSQELFASVTISQPFVCLPLNKLPVVVSLANLYKFC